MNQNKTREQIVKDLPVEIQKIVNFSYLGPRVEKIGKEHFLHIDQVGELYATTEMVMLGLLHPNNFVTSIKKRLEVSQGVAEMVARDVNNQIFLAIREELKKLAEQAPLLEEENGSQDDKTSNLAHDSEHPIESDEHHATLKREDILKDIEDPAPIQTPKTTFARTVLTQNQPAPVKTSPAPSNLPVAHTDNDLPAIIPNMDHSYPTSKPVVSTTPKNTPVNIVTAKLGGVVVTDTTKISQTPATPKTPYRVDPYRESF